MRNPRNNVNVTLGSGPAADRVREMYTAIAERKFGITQSRLLTDMARELVMAFSVEDAATAEKLGLFREAILGPHICQSVVDAYNAKAKKIRDQYLAGSSATVPRAPGSGDAK